MPPAAIVAGVNVYVAVPLAFIVGATLLQPRKNVPFVVLTLKRGDPPWHCVVLASVNDADWNVCPAKPLIVAPADATIGVSQFFSRWSTPFENVDTTGQLTP